MKLPIFGRKPLATSTEVGEAIAHHDTSLAVATVALDKIEAERQDALLYGDDAALDAIEAKAREARLGLDRLQARREALAVQLDELRLSEAADALARRLQGAEQRATAARTWIDKRYPALARELVKGLEAINEAEAEVRAVNAAHVEAGLPEPLQAVEPMQVLTEEPGAIWVPAPALAKLTRLVDLPGKAPGYGKIGSDEVWATSVGL